VFFCDGAARSVVLAFSDLRTAAYCPRQLWYARTQDDRSPPDAVDAVRDLATRYDDVLANPDVLDADAAGSPEADAAGSPDADAAASPDANAAASLDSDLLEVPVAAWVERVRAVREREPRFPDLCDPAGTEVFLSGRECHGIASKVLPGPPVPSLVSPGRPPERGVWEPHAVWAVAAAKALAWERERRVDEAIVEYPRYGVVRRVRLTTRKKAAYRRTVRTVRELDTIPSRLEDTSKCASCRFAEECGVNTGTLRSRLAGD
jgi:CRISPR-associated exonuclease Cas4